MDDTPLGRRHRLQCLAADSQGERPVGEGLSPCGHGHDVPDLSRLCRESRTIVLTYDDGPSPGLTPKLLDLLQRHDATASFFMLGQRLESSVETARTVIQRGHEIGSHSQTHLNAWKSLPWKVGKDLRDGFRAVDGLGAENVLFRPPRGKLTLHSMIQVFVSRRRLFDTAKIDGYRIRPLASR